MPVNDLNTADQPLYNSRFLTWRQQFNPLVGLTIRRLVQMFSNESMGYKSDIQWLYTYIERRDAVLKAVLERRLASMAKLDWTIKIKDGDKSPKAKAQQTYLKELYGGIDNMREAVEFLALATFRGYSHLEKHYSNDGDIIHLEPVPQYLWCHKLPSRDWLYNAKAFQTATGVEINPEDFIIREIDRPVDEIAAISFIRKAMSQKDFDGFIETFGIPPIFIVMPPGVGSGTSPNPDGTQTTNIISEYQEMANKVIAEARGVLPNGADVKLPTESAKNNEPFTNHIRYQDEQIVLAATSGLLTTLTAPTGLNNTQGDNHQDTFMQLAKSEARKISELLQKNIDGPALNKEFPNQDVLAYFELSHNEVEDEDPIDDAGKLSTAGYQIDLSELSEKTGYKLTLKQQPGAEQQPQDFQDYQQYQNHRLEDRIKNIISSDDRDVNAKVKALREELAKN
jgi:phage gp29-like protein